MKLTIHPRALTDERLAMFAKKMKWRKDKALGCLVMLWAMSQGKNKVEASADQIQSWLYAESDQESKDIFDALVRSEYIKPAQTEGQFVIKGNKRALNVYARRKENAKKATEAARSKRKPVKKTNIGTNFGPKLEPTLDQNRTNKETRGAISEFQKLPEKCKALLSGVTHEAQQAWILAYGQWPNFIEGELLKAYSWISANPHKAPKNFQRFFTNWLSRAHELMRKGLPSLTTNSDKNAARLSDMYQKVKDGDL